MAASGSSRSPRRNSMSSLARLAAALPVAALLLPAPASAQAITVLPDQMSTIRLSNRDVNHIVCVGGEIEDVKFSAEKAIAVERAGSDAWVKFLVKAVADRGMVTRRYENGRASCRERGCQYG